jgi:hypothetical protein
MLDDALTCILRRIMSILLQPGNKDVNYIASFYNETVSVFLALETSGIVANLISGIACCHLDNWHSIIIWKLPLCADVS